MGNIGALLTAIAAAVFFTMLLVTANTMGQSIRERINEIGVMKTLGFSSASVTALVLGEALLVTALGGVIGLALAALFAKAHRQRRWSSSSRCSACRRARTRSAPS